MKKNSVNRRATKIRQAKRRVRAINKKRNIAAAPGKRAALIAYLLDKMTANSEVESDENVQA